MKRAALPFLVLAGLVLLFVGLRQASQAGDDVLGADEAGGSDEARQALQTVEHDEHGEHGEPPAIGQPSARIPTGAPSDEELGAAAPLAESGATEQPPAEPTQGPPIEEPLAEERRPLKRYEDGDALALRRGRQIELVTQAQRQARDALQDAEESGDSARAARTRGVLRRLQLRLDALEAAASALEPY